MLGETPRDLRAPGLQETEDTGEGWGEQGCDEGGGSSSVSAGATGTLVDTKRVPNGGGSWWHSQQEGAEPTWT